jgi:hypothetical protein
VGGKQINLLYTFYATVLCLKMLIILCIDPVVEEGFCECWRCDEFRYKEQILTEEDTDYDRDDV